MLGHLFAHNKTDVESVRSSSSLIPAEKLINEVNILRLEHGQPSTRAAFATTYIKQQWQAQLNLSYFGKVSGSAFNGIEHTWGGKWLTDLSLNYQINSHSTVTIGVNNIFDTKPDHWGAAGDLLSQAGFTYGWETLPFGVNGSYGYARLKFTF